MTKKIKTWKDSSRLKMWDGNDNKKREDEDPPPFLKRWSQLYMIVIANLVLCLLTFYIIRKVFE